MVPDEETLEEFGVKHRAKDLCADGGEENLNFFVEGFVSSCRHGDGRASADKVFFFVDSRPCDLPQVRFSVNRLLLSFFLFFPQLIACNAETVDSQVSLRCERFQAVILAQLF